MTTQRKPMTPAESGRLGGLASAEANAHAGRTKRVARNANDALRARFATEQGFAAHMTRVSRGLPLRMPPRQEESS